jgi:hypothetical protein
MTTQEQQDWNDSLVAVFAEPHPEIREVRGERVFVRDLGKRCPWCGHVFFSYQVEGHEQEPYKVDPNPYQGRGVRETCGHPKCHEAEDSYQFKRRQDFRGELAAARMAS